MTTRRKTIYTVIIWLMVGITLLYCSYYSYLNNFCKLSFSKEYDDIAEAKPAISTGIRGEDSFAMFFYVNFDNKNINYLEIEAKGITRGRDNLEIKLGEFDEITGIIPEAEYYNLNINNGINYYDLPQGDYSFVIINIYGEGSASVKNVRFLQNKEPIDTTGAKEFLAEVSIFYIAATALVLLIIYYKKKKVRCEGNSSCYDGIKAEYFCSKTSCYRNAGIQKFTSLLRIILLTFVILNSLFLEMEIHDSGYRKMFKEYLILELLLVIITAVLLIHNCYKNTITIDKFAMAVCSCLALYTLASDLLVDKRFRFSGILIFATLFSLAYICQRYCRREVFITNFVVAVYVFLVLLIVFSIMIPEQAQDSRRYSGPITNPSIYALYLCSIWAVLLGALESGIKPGNKKEFRIAVLVSMAVTLVLILKSQSITPMIALMMVSGIWLLRFATERKGTKFTLIICLLAGMAGIAVIIALYWCSKNLEISSNNRLVEKLQSADISGILSGRDYYWREYLRNMNLLGHGKRPFLLAKRILPHNAIIGIMYMYGVPCVVPYILMMIMAVEKSWRYANTGLKYAAVPFYSIVSFVIMSMADNVEQPFVWLPWIACYLMMAPILVMPIEEIDKLQKGRIHSVITDYNKS